MDLDVVTQYILTIAPAATAIISTISAVIVAIKKIKSDNQKTLNEVKASNKLISDNNNNLTAQIALIQAENLELKQTNAELNRSLKKVCAKMEHLYYIETDAIDPNDLKEIEE